MVQITLLDGSVGQEVVKRSDERATPLWSTSVMMEKPGIVRQVHADYFGVGATVATANTYAVHRDRLVKVGLEDQFEELIDCALSAAEAARDAAGTGCIAGSLGPLGASYRPDICPPVAVAAPLYAELVKIMQDRVDLFIVETVASLAHADGALTGCADSTRPVWLAVTVDDDDGTMLRSGELVENLAEIVAHHAPEAVLVNCSRPEAVEAALEIIRGFGRPFGAYANGFTRISEGFKQDNPTVDALKQRTDLGPVAYAEFAMGWVGQGATIIGGCCEVGPDHIAELTARLHAAGHDIV